MGKKVISFLFVLVLLMSFVSAIETEITVKTMPSHRVHIIALIPGEAYSPIESFHKDSGASGEASVTLSSSADNFNVLVQVTKDGETIITQKFEEEYPAGFPVELEVYPEWYERPVEEVNVSEIVEENSTITEINETEESAEDESELEGEEPNSITGSALFSGDDFFSSSLFYYGGGALVLIIIGIAVFFLLRSRRDKYKKYGFKKEDWKNYNKREREIRESPEEYSEENALAEAERKIKEAQETISGIKNRERVNQLRDKLQEDKRKMIEHEQELLRLRRGERGEGNRGNQNNRGSFKPVRKDISEEEDSSPQEDYSNQ